MINLNPNPAPHWLFEYAEKDRSAVYIEVMPSVTMGRLHVEVNGHDLWLPFHKVQELAIHLNAFLQHHLPATSGTGEEKNEN